MTDVPMNAVSSASAPGAREITIQLHGGVSTPLPGNITHVGDPSATILDPVGGDVTMHLAPGQVLQIRLSVSGKIDVRVIDDPSLTDG